MTNGYLNHVTEEDLRSGRKRHPDLNGVLFSEKESVVYDYKGRPLPESEAVPVRRSQGKRMTAHGPVDVEGETDYRLR